LNLESADVAHEINERPGKIKDCLISSIDKINSSPELLSIENRSVILDRAQTLMGYFDSVRTDSYCIPDELTMMREFSELKTLLSKERTVLRELLAKLS